MTDRIPLDQLNSDQYDTLYERLERAETFVTTVADIIADHQGDKWAAHPATKAIRRGFATVPHTVGDAEVRRQLTAAIKALGTSETALARVRETARQLHTDATSARQMGHETAAYVLEGSARRISLALDGPGPAATEATQAETTARVFAGLHKSAEQDVSRVIALYESWVKAGPPPLGAILARWWDKRLVELRQAILPPTAEATTPGGQRQRLRTATVITRTWNGTRDTNLEAWLGTNFVRWAGNQLVVRTTDSDAVRPEPGWVLARWPDGQLTVSSPNAAARILEPDEEQQPA